MNGIYKNKSNNEVLYVTGGAICQMAYEKKGTQGIKMFLKCDKDSFKKTIEKIFDKSFDKTEQSILDYITNYNK